MAFDLTTEAIAHFIGSFNQVTEQARLRTDHDPFEREGPEYDEGVGLPNINIHVSAPLNLVSFDPGISYKLPLLPLPDRFMPTSVLLKSKFDPSVPYIWNGDFPIGPVEPYAALPSGYSVKFIIQPPPPPSSFAAVVVQQNLLLDSDILIGMTPGELVSPVAQSLALEWLVGASGNLAGPMVPDVPESGDAMATTAHEIFDAVTSYEAAASPPSAKVVVLTGDQAVGTHVDGEATDIVPDLEAALPELPEEDDDVGPAHDVITGGNTIVNQAHVSYSLADAPVIAVMGDSLSLSSISQTNVISDLDMINGALNGPGAEGNTISSIASILSLAASSDDPEAAGGDLPGIPSFASVVRLDGNVVNFNYLLQQNLVNDNDMVSLELSSHGTFIESGGNLAVNAASLLAMSFQYDLIVVGGGIINVSMINQMNVLLDDDFITYPDDDAWSVSGNDNVLWNQASITSIGVDSYHQMSSDFDAFVTSLAEGSDAVPESIRAHEAFAGDDVLSVLYIDGDLINLQIIDQVNIVSDSDQVFLAGGGGGAGLIAGANALINIAAISEFGVDSEIHVNGEAYSDALMHQAGLIVTEDSDLLAGGEGGLVSEAVAFLMDGSEMQPGDNSEGYTGYVSDDELGNDPMGGMVA
ncbi:hypothetical protein [Maritimibacter sp. HL-12]|uniref:hypothetical protein n=1 Tax=Maritimibacter sp. HL-12 TaxID=1162418 RepID=UPI000A0F0B4C|nr:hypothetical protein [Maritimibacter sp. HL-12]SMH53575.1 hypothetical protein SAMN05661107_2806 [Maritimibacter sp. HL-12]